MGRTFGGLGNVVRHGYGRLGALETEMKFIQSFSSLLLFTKPKQNVNSKTSTTQCALLFGREECPAMSQGDDENEIFTEGLPSGSA